MSSCPEPFSIFPRVALGLSLLRAREVDPRVEKAPESVEQLMMFSKSEGSRGS